jgi:DnaJ-class molecular chaperone
MSHAETCPVCAGRGKTKPDPLGNKGGERTCHGCGGSGWVIVEDRQEQPLYWTKTEQARRAM